MGEAAERWKEVQTTRGSPDKEGCGKGKRKVKGLTSEEVSYIKSTATAEPTYSGHVVASSPGSTVLSPRLD